jgi:hypothetical protein
MKNILIAAVALATIASPALAKTHRHVTHEQFSPAYSRAWQSPNSAYARQFRGRSNGYLGLHNTDPDPFIRDYLRHDPPGDYN